VVPDTVCGLWHYRGSSGSSSSSSSKEHSTLEQFNTNIEMVTIIVGDHSIVCKRDTCMHLLVALFSRTRTILQTVVDNGETPAQVCKMCEADEEEPDSCNPGADGYNLTPPRR
jgi:hypothetical protein